MKILLVGGTGVLSTEIMNRSIAEGHDVFVINRGNRRELIPDEVHLLRADINDSGNVNKLIDGLQFDVVADFICYTKDQVENSISIFKSVCNQYIFISSCAVYKIDKASTHYHEDSPLINPIWQYSVDKVECENKVGSLCEQFGMQHTIVRPAVTYGNTRIPYGIMPSYGYHWTLAGRILNSKPVLLWDDGLNAINIMRVEDFAKGFVALYGNAQAYGQAFNITGDECVAWIDVINALGELLGKRPVLATVPKEFLADEMPDRRGEILGGRGVNLKVDNSKIKNVLPDFRTIIPLKEGLKKTLDYYQENHYLCGIDYVFDANIDRIIHKYYKKNAPNKLKEFNLRFIDYLKQGRQQDRSVYFIRRCGNRLLIKVARKCYRFFHRG